MVTDASAKTLLANCASDPSKAFTADDATALNTAFRDIANALMATRLSK